MQSQFLYRYGFEWGKVMRKIVFITSSISFGGAAKMLCYVAESLQKRGYVVCIINLKSTRDTANFERTIDPSVSFYRIKSKSRINQIIEIYKQSKSFGADCIIGFTDFPNMYAALVGRLLRIPSIMSERGDPKKTKDKNKLKQFLADAIINSCSGGVFQTAGARDCYWRHLKRVGCIIPNPIFIEDGFKYVMPSERKKSVVTVGRLDNSQKRYDVMLKAFAKFYKTHPDYELNIYGVGPDEKNIKKWACELGISSVVNLLGLSLHPMEDIADEGMFLITSDFEGISNSLLEAMAAGLPCVSTDHSPGGAKLLIENRINGLLAPIGSVELLANNLSEFADNAMLAELCGNNARRVIERFNPNEIIDLWEDYINNLLKKPVSCTE